MVQSISKKGISLVVKEKKKSGVGLKNKLSIACAVTKQKGRFDDLVDKLTQLNVDEVIPMVTERVVVRWGLEQMRRNHQRWCKIAEQACIQSGRSNLPVISSLKQIKEVLLYSQQFGLKVIPTLIERKNTLRDIVLGGKGKNILVLIGPEGDFTGQEIIEAEKTGFRPVFFGEQVLRVETAAIAVAAFFRLLC